MGSLIERVKPGSGVACFCGRPVFPLRGSGTGKRVVI